jgi:hypothetical protein
MPTPRDYTSAPVSETLGIQAIIAGLANDLAELRAGKISVNDAMARSMLAKQIFNGVRIYLNGTKLLSDNARLMSPAASPVPPAGASQASAFEAGAGQGDGR